jgi:hypothetical protein
MAELIACRDCGADVPYGRLTCPDCGGLLASVTGAARRGRADAQVESTSADASPPDTDEQSRDADGQPRDAEDQARDQPLRPDEQPLESDARSPDLAGAPVREDAAWDLDDGLPFRNDPTPQADPLPEAVIDWPLASTDPAEEPMSGLAAKSETAMAVGTTMAADPAPAAESSMDPDQSVAAASAPATAAAATAAADPSTDPDVSLPWLDRPSVPEQIEPSWTSTPGAYVPPVPTVEAAGPTSMTSGGVAPARAWGSAVGGVAGAYAPPSQPVTDPPSGSPEVRPVDAAMTAPSAIDPAKLTEFIGWLAIAGAALALVGFVLPWSTSVIGATGVSYLDRWGLAGPGHVLIAVAFAGVLVAAVLRERVPLWLGVGLPGLGLGALVVGLAWPYLIGPLGGQLGVITASVGSVVLAAAGVLAIIIEHRPRHAQEESTV